MAIGKLLAPLNGYTKVPQNKPYVDDIFDPLFNREVKEYYNGLYGPIGGIGAGYAAMLENALTGQKGILGPGMGILSTFGRSMDKADDFILGGLTEGVNLVGRGLGGTNESPQNPFKRIFVDDYDYQGVRLMAAAGNAMAKFAGTNTPLDETDFQSLGDKIAGTTIDLATDPGIMGGQLAKLNKGTAVGQMGQIISDYDDFIANIAGNMAFPGGKALIGKGLTRIKNFVKGASSEAPIDMVIKNKTVTNIDPNIGNATYTSLTTETLNSLKRISSDYTFNINPIDDPEVYAIKEEIDKLTNNPSILNAFDYDSFKKDLDVYNTAKAKALSKKDEVVKRIKDTTEKHRNQLLKEASHGSGKLHKADFMKGQVTEQDLNPEILTYFDKQAYNLDDSYEFAKSGQGVNPENYIKTKRLNDLSKEELDEYYINNFAASDEYDYHGNSLEHGNSYEYFKHILDTEGVDEARKLILDKLNIKKTISDKSPIQFAPDKMGFNSLIAKDVLDVVNYHFRNYLAKHPEGFNFTYLKSELGDNKLPENIFNTLVKYNKGKLVDSKSGKITGNKFKNLLDSLYNKKLDYEGTIGEDVVETIVSKNSLIPWIRKNSNILEKTQIGKDLIELADNLEKDIFDNISYETVSKNISTDTYDMVLNPVRMLNDTLSKTNFTKKDLENYAKDFPHFDIKISKDYLKTTPEYSNWMTKRQPILEKIKKYTDTEYDKIYAMGELDRLYTYNSKVNTADVKPILDRIPEKYKYFADQLRKAHIKKDQALIDKLLNSYSDKILKDMKNSNEIINLNKELSAIKIEKTELEKMIDEYYKPAKTKYLKETTKKSYAYDYLSVEPKNVYSAAKKALLEPDINNYKKLSQNLESFSPKDFSKTISSNYSFQDNVVLDSYSKVFDDFKMNWNLPRDMSPLELKPYIMDFGTNSEKTLFGLWSSAVQSKMQNKLKTKHGIMSVNIIQKSKQHVDELVKLKKYNSAQIEEYISRKDIAKGEMISGNNFLESIWASKGIKEFPVPKEMPKKEADKISAALKNNVDIVNKNGNILTFIDTYDEDNIRRIAVFFDADNLNIKKDINKIYGLFGKKNLGLQDVILRDKIISKTAFDSSELDTLFSEINEGTKELGIKIGYTQFDPAYISHTMVDDKDVAEAFSKIYKTLGVDKSKLEKICDALNQQDIASGKLIFGAIPMERSHLGYFGQYKTKNGINMFSTDLNKIHANTFTQGMFENTNVQTFFELFVSDNFKLQNNFEDWQTLKKALNLSEGNFNNLSIVKPRYSDGKLIGFTKFDKFSDTGIRKAFNDKEAILVPDAVLGSLDRMCKKDARMSSKIYRFINKYLTVPFKFGTLANPGFLAGNIQDAYFKQAVELSKKYGTTLSDELTNVAFSMRQVIQLNNDFSNIFDKYKDWLKTTDLSKIHISTKPNDWYMNTFKKSKNTVDTLTIDKIVNDPEMYKAFKEYLNIHVDERQFKLANLYLYLNNNQTSTLFKNNNREMEDLTDLVTSNPYAAPNNIFERIMYGDPSKTKVVKINGKFREVQDKGFNSYGLFLNNPVSNQIIKSSNTIENLMRTSTILNDLQHQGYTLEDVCDILNTDKVLEKQLRAKFNMSMNEAINTMHAANFDYDNVSDVMDKVSYILPFPTFYLKNLAFWADIFTNKPQLIDNVISVHEGLWSGKDTEDEFTAEAKGRGAVPIGQQDTPVTKHLTGIVKQTPYSSMFSAFNAVNDVKQDLSYRTHPILRPVTRHLQEPDDVRYRPYNFNQYQKNIKQGDKEFSELAYMFHQLNPYERTINTALRTPGKIANNSYQLSDFLPSIFQPDFSKKSNK